LKNLLKEKMRRGEVLTGTLVGLGHPDVTEWLSKMGYDWLFIDGEHGPMGYETMLKMMQAMNGTDCIPIVRPQWNDPVVIKRVLDIGAYGIVAPMVNSKEEAELAVRACRYPPEGIRGCGPRRFELVDPDYFQTANKEIIVTVQVESAKAMENLEQILSVDGVDACLVGPFDLSLNLGLPVPPKYDDPRLIGALDRILQAAKNTGKTPGIGTSVERIRWAIEKGFRFNLVGEVDGLLYEAALNALNTARGIK